jgi:hypothetical protein
VIEAVCHGVFKKKRMDRCQPPDGTGPNGALFQARLPVGG